MNIPIYFKNGVIELSTTEKIKLVASRIDNSLRDVVKIYILCIKKLCYLAIAALGLFSVFCFILNWN